MQTYIFARCYTSVMKKISTIIFDLGGVLLNLDQDKTLRAFGRLGLDLDDVNESSSIFNDFETGKLNAADFRHGIKSLKKGEITDHEIDIAWNAMLLETSEERLKLLENLSKHFTLYLLSNTNSIHIQHFRKYIDEHFGLNRWDKLFAKQFLSYEMGKRKPNKDIYLHVLDDIAREADECIFIDDNMSNVRTAAALGIHTIWAKTPLDQVLNENIQTTASAWKKLNQ